MIPKIIHYCWLSGDPYPENVNRCIASWREKLPEYEFILWDFDKVISEFHFKTNYTNYNELHETIGDRKDNLWLAQTIQKKKYAFAADYVRVYALYHYGGIYLDTDVEINGSFDQFLNDRLFIGFDYVNDLEPAVVGAEPEHPWIKKLTNYYKKRSFIREDGSLETDPLPIIFEKTSKGLFSYQRNGKFQQINEPEITIYPYDFFSPKDIYFNKIHKTVNTVTIHHFDGGWVNRDLRYYLKRKFHQVLYMIGGKVFHDGVVELVRRVQSVNGER